MRCGKKDETFEKLGEMAVIEPLKRWLRQKKAKEKYLGNAIECILDLGILVRRKALVGYPTMLSRMYFSSFFLYSLLDAEEDISEYLKEPVDFYERSVKFIQEFSNNDVYVSLLKEAIKKYKGETANG